MIRLYGYGNPVQIHSNRVTTLQGRTTWPISNEIAAQYAARDLSGGGVGERSERRDVPLGKKVIYIWMQNGAMFELKNKVKPL